MARLTTHILDTARGMPAAGVAVRLYSLDDERRMLAATRTNRDGRTDAPLLEGDALTSGTYELEFDVGPYFAATAPDVAGPSFLGTVLVRVGLQSGNDYHIPLLATPWSYSTYRGS